LRAVGDYLSGFYAEDIHKLCPPLGEDFGKRAPTAEEKPYFERYGIRDAFINAKASQWVHENIIEKWLQNTVPVTRLYSWGTVDLAAQSLTLGTQRPIMGENVTLYFAYTNLGSSSISGAK
jgi:hypothetical protein